MEIKDKDGKVISTEGVDAKTLALVTGLANTLETQLASITQQLGETKQFGEQITAISQSIEDLKKAGSPPKDDKPAPDPAKLPAGVQEFISPITDALSKLGEKVDSIASERNQEKAQQTSAQIAESFVAEHYPNLKGKERLQARIAAASVTKPEEAKAIADGYIEDLKSMGVDVEKLTSSPEAEGGKDGQADDIEAKKQEAKEAIQGLNPYAKAS